MVSVIVPVYNVEEYLEQCIESVIAQTYEDWEMILVDDGSTDKSSAICDLWCGRDKRIRVYHQENCGLSEARNRGLECCLGEYILFLDSDDYLFPDCIRRLLYVMEKEACQMCVGNYVNIAGDEIYMGRLNQCVQEEMLDWERYMEKLYTFVPFYAQSWGKLYRREVFSQIRFPKGMVSEDAYVILDVVRECEKICIISDTVCVYRQRPGSISAKPYYEIVDDDLCWMEKHIEFYSKNGLDKLHYAAVRQYCYLLLQRWGELNKEKRHRYSPVLKKRCRYIFIQDNTALKVRVKYGAAFLSPFWASLLFRNRRRR